MFNINQFFLRSLITCTLLTLYALADGNPFVTPFPFKEGVITYAIRGNHIGSKVIYFTDYGQKQLIIENTQNSILQKSSKKKLVTLILSDTKYIINLENNRAEKTPILTHILYMKFQKLTKKAQDKILSNFQKSAPRSIQNLNGSCIAHARTILGKKCTVENIVGVQQCSIARGNLILEESVQLLGYRIERFATAIQKRKVNPEFFKLPPNIKIVSGKNTLEQEANRILLSLSKGANPCRKEPIAITTPNLQRVMFDEIKSLSENF